VKRFYRQHEEHLAYQALDTRERILARIFLHKQIVVLTVRVKKENLLKRS